MKIKNLLKSRERSKQCIQTEGKDNSLLNNEPLIDLIYQLKDRVKCRSKSEQINEAARELEIEVCNAIFNIIKDEVGTVEDCRIEYPFIPIAIYIGKTEVHFKLHGYAYNENRLSYLQALIKYAPKLCQRLEKDLRRWKDEPARDKEVFQTLLDILTPLIVEGKLLR